MRKYFLVSLFCNLLVSVYAQKELHVTNTASNSVVEIKEKDFIKCRYIIYGEYEFLAGGIVDRITDSTIIYRSSFSRRKLININSITNIDRVPFKRNIIPAIVIGLIAGGAETLINPKRSTITTGLLLTGGIALSLNYVYVWNKNQLNKNKVGKNVKLSVH